MGNLTKVTEPNPAGGAAYVTNYTYSALNQQLTVSMPRGAITQIRTFTYNSNQRLFQVTNPENGSTSHYYNADGTLNYKIDASNTPNDSLQRVIMVQRYLKATTEDTNQRTEFQYDYNIVEPKFSQNIAGRLAFTKMTAGGTGGTNTFYEMYSYNPAGRVMKKRLRVYNKTT